MRLDDVLEEISKLEKRADDISNVTDTFKSELCIKGLLYDYIKVHPRSRLEFYVKTILMDYLIDENPFPLITEQLKTKQGAPKRNDIDGAKIYYYLFNNNGSIKKTSDLLQIDRKTVKSRYKYAQKVSQAIISGEYSPDMIEYCSRMNDNLFLDEFNANLQRYENSKKKTKL